MLRLAVETLSCSFGQICKKLYVLQLEFRREPTAYHRRGFQPPLQSASHRRQELTV